MLSLNNDKIRPEVACATPLGGKAYTCCIASKHRRTKMVNNCCVVGCTNYVRKANELGFCRFPMADRGRAAKSGSCAQGPLGTPSTHEDLR